MFGQRFLQAMCCCCLYTCSLINADTQSGLYAAELKPIKASKFKVKARPGNGNSVDDIESVNFYITQDSGETWKQIAEDKVVHEAGQAPYFIFASPKDGTYGFWIQVLYKDGQADKAPKTGSVAPTIRLIDTTKPKIKEFLAGLIAGTEQKLFLEWEVSDKHLGSQAVSIEISTDAGENWSIYKSSLPAKGKDMNALPQKLPFEVRLSVLDKAGNKNLSKAIKIFRNTAAETENKTETAAATESESTAAKAESASKTETSEPTETKTASNSAAQLPSLDEVEKDVDAELAQQQAAEAPAPQVPENHQDIVAPYANKPWPSKYTGEEPVAEETETQASSDQAAIAGQPARLIDEDIALILKRREGRILFGTDAEKILKAARQAVQDGNNERATVLYARLKDSTVAGEALPEEIELHLRLEHIDVARELVRTAPPEVRNTKMRIQEASLLITDNQRKRAISLLTGIIPDDTDDYRNVQLLLARCYIDEQKTRSALTILRPLAQRKDSWGQAAQALIDQMQ